MTANPIRPPLNGPVTIATAAVLRDARTLDTAATSTGASCARVRAELRRLKASVKALEAALRAEEALQKALAARAAVVALPVRQRQPTPPGYVADGLVAMAGAMA